MFLSRLCCCMKTFTIQLLCSLRVWTRLKGIRIDLNTSFPGHHYLIPRPSLPHSQDITASFSGHHYLIPRTSLPHSQAITTSFPGHHCLIPRTSPPPVIDSLHNYTLCKQDWRQWSVLVQSYQCLYSCLSQHNLQTVDTLGPRPLSSLQRLSSFQRLSNICLVFPPSMI